MMSLQFLRRTAHKVTILFAGFGMLLVLPALPAWADDSATADGLSLELIMRDPDWIGTPPVDAYWLLDGETIMFQRKQPGEKYYNHFRLDLASGGITQLDAADMADVPAPGGNFNAQRSLRVYANAGDIYVEDQQSGDIRQLTRTSASESKPFFMADGRIAWRIGDSHFIHDLGSGLTAEAAQLLAEDDPAQPESGFDYLEDQQTRLFSTLRREEAQEDSKRKHAREQQKQNPDRLDPAIYLGKDTRIISSSLSPNGRWMIVVTEPANHDGGKNDSMPNYVTGSGYVENRDVRTLVGLNAPAPETARLVDLESGGVTALDTARLPGIKDDPFADLRDEALAYHVKNGGDREAVKTALEPPAIRPVEIEGIEWTQDGSRVAVQLHSIDNKDRWIATVDLERKRYDSQHRLTFRSGWVNWYYNEFGWLPDNETLWYLSEESGYSQLYTKRPDRRATALTSGAFVVSSPALDNDGSHFYFLANRERPGVHQVYRVASDGGDIEQLTTIGVEPSSRQRDEDDLAPFMLSPDGSMLLFKHDSPTRPPELYVQAIGNGSDARKLTSTASEEYLSYDWKAPEIVRVPSTHFDGSITSRVYTPTDFDPSKKYPAVIFVHGAGYLHNAHEGFSSYFREFMFNNILLRHGYVVIDMDYRGSRGYGAKWRNAIYRQMGHPELEDLLDGIKWLAENKSVDPERVGVYGGSYGGFMAFMALFRAPDSFAAGAALRPVTDWMHYNHGYTSNILNTPLVDPMAFEKSSPIEYAAQYENTPMLIAHGMQDDNVFFKDSVRLVQRLIELKKENYTIAPYPLDPHGFKHPESWLDEYRRIFKLMEENVK